MAGTLDRHATMLTQPRPAFGRQNFSSPPKGRGFQVHSSEFESWIEPEIRQIGGCVDRLLTDCSVMPNEVDAIFMTGGSSFVPAIRNIFEKKFGADTPIRAGQEFTSVAQGLAIHALELLD
jgi:hypothetical chaperone protein